MNALRPRLALILLPAAGLAVGWLAGGGHDAARAGGGTRSGAGESMILAGPVRVESAGGGRFGMGRVQSAMDALYWIDFRAARLFAAIPSSRKTSADAQLLRDFAERDLIADFGLKPKGQVHFLMQTAALGGLGGGAAMLVVVEASSRQVAAYQALPRPESSDGRPQFERLQVVRYGEGSPPPADPWGEPLGVSGTVLVQPTPDGSQAPLEAVYWLESEKETTLRAVVPTMQRTADSARVLGPIVERDLARDFGLAPGSAPQFLISPVSLGAGLQGAGILAVVEMTTRQVAAYKFPPTAASGGSARPALELIQIKPYVEAKGGR